MPNCKDQWLLKWIPRFCQVLVKKATTTPRIPKLYTLLKTVIQISSKHLYFEQSSLISKISRTGMEVDSGNNVIEADTERRNTFNMLLTFLKDLIGKSEEF